MQVSSCASLAYLPQRHEPLESGTPCFLVDRFILQFIDGHLRVHHREGEVRQALPADIGLSVQVSCAICRGYGCEQSEVPVLSQRIANIERFPVWRRFVDDRGLDSYADAPDASFYPTAPDTDHRPDGALLPFLLANVEPEVAVLLRRFLDARRGEGVLEVRLDPLPDGTGDTVADLRGRRRPSSPPAYYPAARGPLVMSRSAARASAMPANATGDQRSRKIPTSTATTSRGRGIRFSSLQVDAPVVLVAAGVEEDEQS